MGITIGNKIELVSLNDIMNNVQNKKVFISKVYDFIDENTLQIAMPIYDGKIVPLSVGTKFSACFYTDKGLYECDVVVSSRYKDGNLFFLDISMLSSLKKVQRREFFRYSCLLNGKIRVMSDEEYESGVSSEDENEADWNDMRIVDISGGGLKLYCSKHIDSNEVVKVSFVLPIERDVYRLNLTGRILRSTILEGRSDIYDTRVEFLNINPAERDKIVKYIFESERMNRAKETGLN